MLEVSSCTMKRANLKAVEELGILQEANREIFHPVGYHLHLKHDDKGAVVGVDVSRTDQKHGCFYTKKYVESGEATHRFVRYRTLRSTIYQMRTLISGINGWMQGLESYQIW